MDYNIDVWLVNAYHVKNVPGRKSDVVDAQWLQELHTNGYLKSCFQPDNLTRSLRNYVRYRKIIIQDMTTETQRMQKAMIQMNIKLHDGISDIHGETGKKIINAILEGERDPKVLSKFKSGRIKASRETLEKSLEGTWREEQLYNLKTALERYHFYEKQLKECDIESEHLVQKMQEHRSDDIKINDTKPIPALTKKKNQPDFNVAQYLSLIYGVDVTQI